MTETQILDVELAIGERTVSFRLGDHGGLDFIAGHVGRAGLARYETPLPGLVVSLVDGGGVMLDIGANNGLFSLLACAASPSLDVYAFEPLAEAWSALGENLALNPGLAERIHPQQLALSATNGPVDFFATVNDQGFLSTSSSLEEAHARMTDHGRFDRQEVVSATLDTWAALHLGDRQVRLIKMDVERHEHAVLEGGWDVVCSSRPIIVLEVLPEARVETIERLMASERYLHFAIAADRFRFMPHVGYVHGAENHLLCPAERAADIIMLAQRHELLITPG